MRRKSFITYLEEEKNQRNLVEQDLNLRLRQQEATAWLGEYALGCTNLDTLLQEATRLVSETLDMEFCKILELIPGDRLLLRAGVGWKPGLVGSLTIGTEYHSQAGFTLLSKEPVIVQDLTQEKRFSDLELLVEHNVVSGMSVVIPGVESPFGALSVHSAHPRTFFSYDTRFIKAIAGILASAIERSRAEDELRRSRDELSIILQGVMEGVTVQDRQGRLIYVNQAAARMMGFQTVEEVSLADPKTILAKFSMLDEDGHPFPAENLPGRLVLQGAPSATARVRFRVQETGEERWSIIDATPVYDESGKVMQAVNIFRDISDLVLSEHYQRFLAEAGALLNSSLDYETTLTNVAKLSVNGLADWCTIHLVRDSQIVFQSAAHSDPEKMDMARRYQEIYVPDLSKRVGLGEVIHSGEAQYYPKITDAMLEASTDDPEQLKVLRELGMQSVIIVPLKTRDETIGAITFIWAESGRKYTQRDVELTNELARRASIAIENAWLFREARVSNEELEQRVKNRTRQLETSNRLLLHEVEERRKAQLALEESETLLNSLFEFAPDAMVLVDQTGVIVRTNQQAEQLFGWPRKELVGNRIEQLIPARYRGGHIHKRSNYLHEMVTRSMGKGLELFAVSRDGREFPVDIMLAPLRAKSGDLIICAVRDMTEQKRLQSELSELHRRLFESVEEERLSISRELHDGPIQDLYGVSISLESMKSLIPDDGISSELELTKENVQLVVDALRSVCGELRPPTLGRFGLEKAIRSHLTKIRDTHPEINFEARLMEDGGMLSERVRLALFRVYQNSVTNIIRHAQASNVMVLFNIDNGMVNLMIQDDGKGFQMPNKWIDLAREGHFGLVGMIERIQAVGGRLEIQSEIGEGTTISVFLPLEDQVPAGPVAAQ